MIKAHVHDVPKAHENRYLKRVEAHVHDNKFIIFERRQLIRQICRCGSFDEYAVTQIFNKSTRELKRHSMNKH